MIRFFILFASLFGFIFTVIWAASFTKYFDKARVKRITRVTFVAAGAILFTICVVVFIFGLEHTIF